MKKALCLALFFGLLAVHAKAQNVTITDDQNYTADTSAMLDVKSTTKGMLIPRVTTTQRNAIYQPATGLLVYDTDSSSFFFFNGTGWTNLSHGNASESWKMNGSNIYLSDDYRVGINKTNPLSALEVKANVTALDTDPLFQVINKTGDTVFAVFPDGVQINFDESTKGNIGGFAVSGRSATKGSREYLRVTTDSTRIYLNETLKGNIGGFAVSGRSATKGAYDEFLRVTPDSTRVYVNESTKGNIGGFAVSGRSATKGTTTQFMDITPDNYFIGHEAGKSVTSGLYNLFLGYQSGVSDTSGSNNVFIGNSTGYNNANGEYNVFLGNEAGYNVTTGSDNVLLGYQAGYNVTTAGNNISIGSEAGKNNTNNSDNIFLGRQAGFYHTEDTENNPGEHNNNIYMGYQAGYGDVAGEEGVANVFIGNQSGYNNSTGIYNIIIGNQAGHGNTTGSNNVMLGDLSGFQTSTGLNNVFLGNNSGYSNGSGWSNVFIGNGAGYELADHDKNVFIGEYAGGDANAGGKNVFMGVDAGRYHHAGDNNIYMGTAAGKGNDSYTGICQRNVILGDGAGNKIKEAIDNVFIGHLAGEGFNGTGVTGGYNVIIGEQAGRHIIGGDKNVFMGNQAGLYTEEGKQNVFIGYQAGRDNIGDGTAYNGNYQVFIGYQAGLENENGQSNVYIGEQSGRDILSGVYNTFVGKNTGFEMASGDWNVMLGAQSGEYKTGGNSNVQIGNHSGSKTEAGAENVFVGLKAGYNFGGATDGTNAISRNVCVGFQSGWNGIGTNNVLVGYKAGRGLVHNTSTGNVMLGYMAGASYTGSNKLFIDNSSDATPLIYGDFDTEILTINGTLNINGTYDMPTSNGTSGQVLVTNGTDAAYWNSISSGTITADNGVSLSSNQVQLGGDLLKSTYIDHNSFSLFHRLDGTGNFYIYDGTDYAFTVTDDAQGGNVGIGTSNPSSDLHLYQSVNATFKVESNTGTPAIILDGADGAGNFTTTYQEDGAYKASFGWQATDDYFFVYEGGINSIVSKGGNIGLGTTSPGTKLHIKASGTSFGSGIRMETSQTTSEDWYLYMNTDDDFVFRNDAYDYVTFQKNTGNVGIGTITPDYALQVNGTIAPESDKTYDLGTSGLKWKNVYSYNLNKNSAKYFSKQEAMQILSTNGLKNSSKNEVLIESFPTPLKNGNHFLIGETAVFNYQVNSYQQEIIDQLKKENQLLREANSKILNRLEKIEKQLNN